MTPFSLLSRLLRRYRDRTSGSMVVESIFAIPILALGMTGFFTFWDVYRSQNMVQKASYAVADMLSREMVPATPGFLTGLETTLEFLIREDATIRVTSIRRISDGPLGLQGLDVLWSFSPGNQMVPLTEATLTQVLNDVPMMAIGSNMVVLEVTVPYAPLTDILDVDSIREVVSMRPRFLPTLCMQGVVC